MGGELEEGKPSRSPLGCEAPKLNIATKSVYLQRPCLALLCSLRLFQKMKPLGNWRFRIYLKKLSLVRIFFKP